MKFGVVVFPGSNCEQDVVHVLKNVMKQEVIELWHKDKSLEGFSEEDCIILPGGFSFGDYLRSGAIARFSPIMESVIAFANRGGKVWGICNGFQILCEAGLLPGALLRNKEQKFICKNVYIKSASNDSFLTSEVPVGEPLKIPVAHAEGRYYADEQTIAGLKINDQFLFYYCDGNGDVTKESNMNGSTENIAGICNENRNVIGMMPHPERAAEAILGNTDGRSMFDSLVKNYKLVG